MTSRICLLVGGRDFVASEDTLVQGSSYFRALLSDKYESKDADGRFYVDADPDLFQDVLRYLRRGIYPLYWDKSKGHDYAKYLALQAESSYFQIEKLSLWLQEEKYLSAVTISTSVTAYEGPDNSPDMLNAFKKAADETIEYITHTQTVKKYICPRGIPGHRGEPRRCGRQCHNAQGDEIIYEDEVMLTVLTIMKKICFDRSICTDLFNNSVSASGLSGSAE